jgi:hypothetical protein
MDRVYLTFSFIYALLGMVLGIVMAASGDHGQLVTHAHIMLAGFVVSFIYGVTYRFWLSGKLSDRWVWLQLVIHQVGIAMLAVGLYLAYGGHVDKMAIEPVLIAASLMVVGGMALMFGLFLCAGR